MFNAKTSQSSLISSLMYSVIGIVLIVQTLGCGNAEGVSNKFQPEFSQEDAVVLEMYTESKYSVYPPGKRLDMKVYQSGQAEYDHYPSQQTSENSGFKRTSFTLTPDELEKIESLAAQILTDSKEFYGPTVPILDAAIETTLILNVKGGQKKIVLKENHSNLILEKKKDVYPESLLNLLLFIQNKDDKLLGIRREII